jgi:hypothetical protein
MVIRSKSGEVNTSLLIYVILGLMLVVVVGFFMFGGQGEIEDVAKLISPDKQAVYATSCKNVYLGNVNTWCKDFGNIGVSDKEPFYSSCDYLVKERKATIDGSEIMEGKCIPTEVRIVAGNFCTEKKLKDDTILDGQPCAYWKGDDSAKMTVTSTTTKTKTVVPSNDGIEASLVCENSASDNAEGLTTEWVASEVVCLAKPGLEEGDVGESWARSQFKDADAHPEPQICCTYKKAVTTPAS